MTRFLITSLLLFTSVTALAQDELNKVKIKLIDQFVEIIDGGKTSSHYIEHYVEKYGELFLQHIPGQEERLKGMISEEVGAYVSDEQQTKALYESVRGSVHQRFTTEELKKILRFYKTDTGKKTLKHMPGLMYDTGILAQQWGMSLEVPIRDKIARRLKKEGISPKSPHQ